MIRQLKPGELLPAGTPSRYLSAQGYVRLRWYISTKESLETYEHRVEGDRVTLAEHVHHINHVRDDNRPENLERLTATEHAERHSPTADRCIELYRQGLPTTEIGRLVNRASGNVWRILQYRGVLEQRNSTYYAPPLPSDEQLREWHAAGVRAARIVAMTGVGRGRINRRFDELGLPRFGSGNPKQVRDENKYAESRSNEANKEAA